MLVGEVMESVDQFDTAEGPLQMASWVNSATKRSTLLRKKITARSYTHYLEIRYGDEMPRVVRGGRRHDQEERAGSGGGAKRTDGT